MDWEKFIKQALFSFAPGKLLPFLFSVHVAVSPYWSTENIDHWLLDDRRTSRALGLIMHNNASKELMNIYTRWGLRMC